MNPLHAPSNLGLHDSVDALSAHAIPVCNCGQDLDMVRRRHCPRCGVALRQLSLAA